MGYEKVLNAWFKAYKTVVEDCKIMHNTYNIDESGFSIRNKQREIFFTKQ